MKILINKILLKFGYVPHEYLHQSRKRVRELKLINHELRHGVDRFLPAKKPKPLRNIPSNKNKIPNQNDELSHSKLRAWSKKVREDCSCDICGETENLSAHHIFPKSLFKSLAYDESNGVALCIDCHAKYHELYSNELCTPKSYMKFKSKRTMELFQSNGGIIREDADFSIFSLFN